MLGLRVVLLGAPTSLAGIMVIDPHHAAATHTRRCSSEPKRASGSTWFGKVSQLEVGLSSCVLVAISPRRGELGGGPRGRRMRAPGRNPSAGPRPPLSAVAPPAANSTRGSVLQKAPKWKSGWQKAERGPVLPGSGNPTCWCVVSRHPYGGGLVECQVWKC
jgi:hypothetical protein